MQSGHEELLAREMADFCKRMIVEPSPSRFWDGPLAAAVLNLVLTALLAPNVTNHWGYP